MTIRHATSVILSAEQLELLSSIEAIHAKATVRQTPTARARRILEPLSGVVQSATAKATTAREVESVKQFASVLSTSLGKRQVPEHQRQGSSGSIIREALDIAGPELLRRAKARAKASATLVGTTSITEAELAELHTAIDAAAVANKHLVDLAAWAKRRLVSLAKAKKL